MCQFLGAAPLHEFRFVRQTAFPRRINRRGNFGSGAAPLAPIRQANGGPNRVEPE